MVRVGGNNRGVAASIGGVVASYGVAVTRRHAGLDLLVIYESLDRPRNREGCLTNGPLNLLCGGNMLVLDLPLEVCGVLERRIRLVGTSVRGLGATRYVGLRASRGMRHTRLLVAVIDKRLRCGRNGHARLVDIERNGLGAHDVDILRDDNHESNADVHVVEVFDVVLLGINVLAVHLDLRGLCSAIVDLVGNRVHIEVERALRDNEFAGERAVVLAARRGCHGKRGSAGVRVVCELVGVVIVRLGYLVAVLVGYGELRLDFTASVGLLQNLADGRELLLLHDSPRSLIVGVASNTLGRKVGGVVAKLR